MLQFETYFAISLAKIILLQTDNLATALQQKKISATEGKELYKVTAKTLLKIRNETFDQFWEQTLKESKELGIEDPKLKRKSKIPKKLADYFIHQDEPENFADTVEGHYKAIFFKSFDLVLECMKDRFEEAADERSAEELNEDEVEEVVTSQPIDADDKVALLK